MRFAPGLGLVGILSVVAGYQNTAPFVLVSSSRLDTSPFLQSSTQTSSQVTSAIKQVLSKCPSDVYILVHQPGVSSGSHALGDATPYLKQLVLKPEKRAQSSATVENTLGHIDLDDLAGFLEGQCHTGQETIMIDEQFLSVTHRPRPVVLKLMLDPVPNDSDRASRLAVHDSYLQSLVSHVFLNDSFSVVYTASPPTSEFILSGENPSPIIGQHFNHELRRDLTASLPARKTSSPGLFDQYQFFGPGIFSGLLVVPLIALVLYLAASALFSLQVSYYALAKEPGPIASTMKNK